jgi:hypothetical protein
MAARRERVQAHRPACHLRAIRTGLGRSLAVSHGHSRHPDLRAALYRWGDSTNGKDALAHRLERSRRTRPIVASRDAEGPGTPNGVGARTGALGAAGRATRVPDRRATPGTQRATTVTFTPPMSCCLSLYQLERTT